MFNNELVSSAEDGRLNSALSEDIVIEWVKVTLQDHGYSISKAKPRYWYDMLITDKETSEEYPINVKITNGKQADNISSKKGFYFAMTSENPEEAKINNWESFIEKITTKAKLSSADYYFLVIFKESKEVLFTSLKRIDKLTPNGNNLPFQCKWNDNKQETNRTENEQFDYLKQVFLSSYLKRAPSIDKLIERWG